MSDFNPNVAPSSHYAIEVFRVSHARVGLKQDNGQVVVVNIEDLADLFKTIEKEIEDA